MTAVALTINGQPLRDLGAVIRFLDRRFLPPRGLAATSIATRFGGVHGVPNFGPRLVHGQGWIVPTPRTRATLVAALTSLEELVYQGAIVVRAVEPSNQVREIVGMTTRWEPTSQGAFATVQWEISCDDPTWRSLAPELLPLPAGIAVPIPCGTAPSGWIATVAGQPTNPFTLTFRHASGELLTTMSFAVALGATEFLTVDGGAMTVTKTTAGGAPTNAMSVLTGNFPPRGITPEGAWRAGTSYPTVALSTGSGDLFTWPRWLG